MSSGERQAGIKDGNMPWPQSTELYYYDYDYDYFLNFLFLERECVHAWAGKWDSWRVRENLKQAPCSAGSHIQGSTSWPWDHDPSWNQESVVKLNKPPMCPQSCIIMFNQTQPQDTKVDSLYYWSRVERCDKRMSLQGVGKEMRQLWNTMGYEEF